MISGKLAMSLFFWLNNIHFSLELLGALAFVLVAWLAFDSFSIKRDFLTFARGLGFSFLAAYQVFHAFDFRSDVYIYFGYILFFIGIAFILINLSKEAFLVRPKYTAVLVLPGFTVLGWIFKSVGLIGFGLVTLLSFYQYKNETKKSLIPFIWGSLFLSGGALLSLFYNSNSFNLPWILGHVFELAGFIGLMWWVWGYLQLRIREEVLIIMVSITLFMGILISLTFSTILVNQVENLIKSSLESNVKILGLQIEGMKEEARVKSSLIANRMDVTDFIAKNDFVGLENLGTDLLSSEKLGFLIFLNSNGEVILRAHALSKKEDNLSNETAVKSALAGKAEVAIENSPGESFSVRAAHPVYANGNLIGVIVAGFQLDNAFVDLIKKETGSDISVFDGGKRVATTVLNPDNRTRSAGVEETDPEVRAVLTTGKSVTLRTEIASRPFLASYLPLIDNSGKAVGMISSAKPQQDILNIILQTNRFTLLIVMIIILILINPIYFISKRLGEDVHI